MPFGHFAHRSNNLFETGTNASTKSRIDFFSISHLQIVHCIVDGKLYICIASVICRYRTNNLVKTKPEKKYCLQYFCLGDFFPCIVMFFNFYTAIVISRIHELSNRMTLAVHCQVGRFEYSRGKPTPHIIAPNPNFPFRFCCLL